MIAAAALGAVFLALTFKWWFVTAAAMVATLAAIVYWLWTGTAEIPEKSSKDIGLGLSLPLYASGPASVGWWAMFITMVGDATGFASLVFGYFFYWTIHEDFTAAAAGPGVGWPLVAVALFVAAWGAMLFARSANARGGVALSRLAIAGSLVLAVAASVALLVGPSSYGMNPQANVYPAIVWVLVGWTLAHVAVGVIMQVYCLARSFAGRLTDLHDMDLRNTCLYWHFLMITAAITGAVIGVFPEVSR